MTNLAAQFRRDQFHGRNLEDSRSLEEEFVASRALSVESSVV